MSKDYFISVSQLNSYVDSLLYSDAFLKRIAVKGEVVDINKKYGNMFLTLRDEKSSLDCFLPDYILIPNIDLIEPGASIIAVGSVGLYQKSGRFRMKIEEFSIYGEGEYLLELEKLKKKLAAEGLFDVSHKLTLPMYPRHVGLITSSTGAVVHDIQNVAMRRDPSVRLSIYPVRVQGTDAPADIMHAIDYYESNSDADVIIICRGGGAIMDLAPFNSEMLARRIYNALTPIVSAVGHEINYSICDYVSDLRAPTPSAAAEIVIPAREDILNEVAELRQKSFEIIIDKIDSADKIIEKFDSIKYEEVLRNAFNRYYDFIMAYDSYISKAVLSVYNTYKSEVELLNEQLELLNPYATLKRGYVLAKKEGKHISSVKDLYEGDRLELMFSDGNISVSVLEDRDSE